MKRRTDSQGGIPASFLLLWFPPGRIPEHRVRKAFRELGSQNQISIHSCRPFRQADESRENRQGGNGLLHQADQPAKRIPPHRREL